MYYLKGEEKKNKYRRTRKQSFICITLRQYFLIAWTCLQIYNDSVVIGDASDLAHYNSAFLPSHISDLILNHMLTAWYKTYLEIKEYFSVNLDNKSNTFTWISFNVRLNGLTEEYIMAFVHSRSERAKFYILKKTHIHVPCLS